MSSANIVKYNIKNVHAAVLTKGSCCPDKRQ